MKPLSKSNYTIGMECPGHLWLQYNDKEKIPPHPPGVLKRFEQGTIVGQWAKKIFPDGIDIPEDDFKANLEKSKELLKDRKILFEVAVQVDNLYGRADILVPVGKDEWDVIEVKSGTKVDKKKHYWDVSFQLYVYRKAGLKIRKCFLMHLLSINPLVTGMCQMFKICVICFRQRMFSINHCINGMCQM